MQGTPVGPIVASVAGAYVFDQQLRSAVSNARLPGPGSGGETPS